MIRRHVPAVRHRLRPAADLELRAPAASLSDSMREMRRRNLPRRYRNPGEPFFDGHEALLVRTALVRAQGFSEATARPVITDSDAVRRLCGHLADADNEYVVVLSLDNGMRVQGIYEAAAGGRRSAEAEFRQIAKTPLLLGAVGCIVVHNHPSGDPTPSPEDLRFTQMLRDALRCAGVELLDHVVIAGGGHRSFAESGYLGPGAGLFPSMRRT